MKQQQGRRDAAAVRQQGGQQHDDGGSGGPRGTSTSLFLCMVGLLLSITIAVENVLISTSIVSFEDGGGRHLRQRRATVAISNEEEDDGTDDDDTASIEQFVRRGEEKSLQAAPTDIVAYQDMDAMCTLQRYTHLFETFCHHDLVDDDRSSSCDLGAFKGYFKNHGANEGLVGGCNVQEAICYARRYPAIFVGYCNASVAECDYYSLRNHYEQYGMKEQRAWGCSFQPIQVTRSFLAIWGRLRTLYANGEIKFAFLNNNDKPMTSSIRSLQSIKE
jgi:hypothetical protein